VIEGVHRSLRGAAYRARARARAREWFWACDLPSSGQDSIASGTAPASSSTSKRVFLLPNRSFGYREQRSTLNSQLSTAAPTRPLVAAEPRWVRALRTDPRRPDSRSPPHR
jgi:hypothetical protein